MGDVKVLAVPEGSIVVLRDIVFEPDELSKQERKRAVTEPWRARSVVEQINHFCDIIEEACGHNRFSVIACSGDKADVAVVDPNDVLGVLRAEIAAAPVVVAGR